MLNARGCKQLRREVALQRVHLGHRVGDRRAGGKDDAAPAVALAEIAGLHIHIERAVALGVRQSGDAVHLGDESEILVEVSFIDKYLVNAQLLEGERVVLVLAVGAVLELCGQGASWLFRVP